MTRDAICISVCIHASVRVHLLSTYGKYLRWYSSYYVTRGTALSGQTGEPPLRIVLGYSRSPNSNSMEQSPLSEGNIRSVGQDNFQFSTFYGTTTFIRISQGRVWRWLSVFWDVVWYTLMMEAVSSSKTSVNICRLNGATPQNTATFVHKSPPPVPTLSQKNSVQHPHTPFFQIHLNIYHPVHIEVWSMSDKLYLIQQDGVGVTFRFCIWTVWNGSLQQDKNFFSKISICSDFPNLI
jgi:hypothetical protein